MCVCVREGGGGLSDSGNIERPLKPRQQGKRILRRDRKRRPRDRKRRQKRGGGEKDKERQTDRSTDLQG